MILVYNHPNGEMTYTHEGLCYTVEYEWYPADDGEPEFIAIRVLRGGKEVRVAPVLHSKMTTAALRDARLYECGLCPKPDPLPGLAPSVRLVPSPPPPAPKAGSRRAQISLVSPADRR
jgi:hypothetical protein